MCHVSQIPCQSVCLVCSLGADELISSDCVSSLPPFSVTVVIALSLSDCFGSQATFQARSPPLRQHAKYAYYLLNMIICKCDLVKLLLLHSWLNLPLFPMSVYGNIAILHYSSDKWSRTPIHTTELWGWLSYVLHPPRCWACPIFFCSRPTATLAFTMEALMSVRAQLQEWYPR